MRPSIVKHKLARKEPVIGIALHLTDPSVYEMTSLLGFDYIWMDLEHHAYSVETANNLMRAARVGTSDIMARPAKGEFMRLGRLLESGAYGILYPRCDNADEARQVVPREFFVATAQHQHQRAAERIDGRNGPLGSGGDRIVVPEGTMPVADKLQAVGDSFKAGNPCAHVAGREAR